MDENKNVLNDRFEIKEKISQGGFGITYLAYDMQTPISTKCVVKKLQPRNISNMTDAKKRFFREADALKKVGIHKSIPTLYEYFEAQGEFFIVQEFIEGKVLRNMIEDYKTSEVECLKFLKRILEILVFIHKNKVIHRDINPSNIILRNGDIEDPVMIDFGLVKEIVSPNEVEPTLCVGTRAYIAPEQMAGNPKPTSDLFSLGWVGVELITGFNQFAFIDSYAGQLDWSKRTPNLSREFIEILKKATASNLHNRYQTAEDMKEEIIGLLKSKNISTNQQNNDDYIGTYESCNYVAAKKILERSKSPFGWIHLRSPWEDPVNNDLFNYFVRTKMYDEIMRFTNQSKEALSEFRVLVGEKGEGKTHILCKLRDKLIDSDKCIFIYINPGTIDSYNYEGSDFHSHIYFHMLRQIEDSILQQMHGQQGFNIVQTILNHYVIPFIRNKYGEHLDKVNSKNIGIFFSKLKDVLWKYRSNMDALFDAIRLSYIAENQQIEHDTVFFLFKFALLNYDKNNLVHLSKWLRGVSVGEKRISRTDKALSAIKTINDIIVQSGKTLVIVFDQFERTISERIILDNLREDKMQDELYQKLDKFFSNIWQLMETTKKLFFIFSLREQNWRAFKHYLQSIDSHLESRFSDIYVLQLEQLKKEQAFSILRLFLEKFVYKEVGVNESELVTENFPYFKDQQERDKKLRQYVEVLNLNEIDKLEIFQFTLDDYYALSNLKGKTIIRNFLHECCRAYAELLDVYRYKLPTAKEAFFPDTSKLEPKKYISPNFVSSINGEKRILETVKMYLTTLITEYSFVKDISIIKDDSNVDRIDYLNKRISKPIKLSEISLVNDDLIHSVLISIQLPLETTNKQLENCFDLLNKSRWLLNKKSIVSLIKREGFEGIKRTDLKTHGSFNVLALENLVCKMERELDFIFSVRVRNTVEGKDKAHVGSIDYDKRTIVIILPHKYTKDSRQAKIILGLHKDNTIEAMDKARNILSKWITDKA